MIGRCRRNEITEDCYNMTSNSVSDTAVIALAGRRIDVEGADPPQFPLRNIQIVRERLAELFEREQAIALVSSAACGSDLIALEEAERLRIRRRIILPFSQVKFRLTSVVDRPGEWKSSYDRLIEIAEADSDLVTLKQGEVDAGAAYAEANNAIIREAQFLARAMPGAPHRLVGVIVWEGRPRPNNDATNDFKNAVILAGFDLHIVLTS